MLFQLIDVQIVLIYVLLELFNLSFQLSGNLPDLLHSKRHVKGKLEELFGTKTDMERRESKFCFSFFSSLLSEPRLTSNHR